MSNEVEVQTVEDGWRGRAWPPNGISFTKRVTALNGHTQILPLSYVQENGEPHYSEWMAWCADDCAACARGKASPINIAED